MRSVPSALALGLLACGTGDGAIGAPPPEGFPWLAERFDLTPLLVAIDCEGSAAPWSPRAATLEVAQNGTRVTATLRSGVDATARALSLAGCLVQPGEGRFALRLSGASRSATTVGRSACAARLALPGSRGEALDRAEALARAEGRAGGSLDAAESVWLARGCPAEEGGFPHFELAVCTDGALEGLVDAQLAWSGAACHEGPPCTLALGFEANVVAPRPDTPAGALLGGACD